MSFILKIIYKLFYKIESTVNNKYKSNLFIFIINKNVQFEYSYWFSTNITDH